MFRDESKKVMRRAHQKWGTSRPSEDATSSSTTSTSPSSNDSHLALAIRQGSPYPVDANAPTPTTLTFIEESPLVVAASRLPKAVQSTTLEKGTRFYIERYIIGYPQEPATAADFHMAPWFSSPVISDIMAAVGLQALANLNKSKQIQIAARERYTLALANTVKLIKNSAQLDPGSSIRSVVMLAIFEVVSGTSEDHRTIRNHILGAASLVNHLIPSMSDQTMALRVVVQLCCSLMIPCYKAGVDLPKESLEYIHKTAASLPPEQKAAPNLVLIVARFIHLSILLQQQSSLQDEPRAATNLLSKALHLESQLAEWEASQQTPGSIWAFSTEVDHSLPPEACYQQQFHVYAGGMWTALVWNYYRWARILVNEMILLLSGRLPSDASLQPLPQHPSHYLAIIHRQAEETLVSLPTHYRHPVLTRDQRAVLDKTFAVFLSHHGGSAGVPIVMVQLQVAACAVGAQREFAVWALEIFETIWKDTGMLLGKKLTEYVRAHLNRQQGSITNSAAGSYLRESSRVVEISGE